MIEIITPLAHRVEDIEYPGRRDSREFARQMMESFRDTLRRSLPTSIDVSHSREEVGRLARNLLLMDLMSPTVIAPKNTFITEPE